MLVQMTATTPFPMEIFNAHSVICKARDRFEYLALIDNLLPSFLHSIFVSDKQISRQGFYRW
jgi:hypothetical protein